MLIKGIIDNLAITLNLVIIISNQILPTELIYTGKTKASQPCAFSFFLKFLSVRTQNIGETRWKP